MGTTTDIERVDRPWGHFFTVYQTPHTWFKILVINEGSQTSLQKHAHRMEHWTVAERGLLAQTEHGVVDLVPGVRYTVRAGEQHRLINPTRYPISVMEVAVGNPREDDIVRLEDDYGRASAGT